MKPYFLTTEDELELALFSEDCTFNSIKAVMADVDAEELYRTVPPKKVATVAMQIHCKLKDIRGNE